MHPIKTYNKQYQVRESRRDFLNGSHKISLADEKASRNLTYFDYQSVPQRRRFANGNYSSFQLTRKLTTKQQIILDKILYLLATRDVDQLQCAHAYIAKYVGLSRQTVISTIDLLIARGNITCFSLPRYSKEYSRALIYAIPSFSPYYSALQQTRASLRGMEAVSQRNFTQLMNLYLSSSLLPINSSLESSLYSLALSNMTREARPQGRTLMSESELSPKRSEEGNDREKKIRSAKIERIATSVDYSAFSRYHLQTSFSSKSTPSKGKNRQMYTYEQKEFVLSELKLGNKVDFYPSQVHKMFGLNEIAKIKLCAFSDEIIAAAYNKTKNMRGLKNPFKMLTKLCTVFSQEKGIEPDFKWPFQLINAIGMNPAIEPMWDMHTDNEKKDRRPLSQPKPTPSNEFNRWASMPKEDMDDLAEAIAQTDFSRFDRNPGLKASMMALADRIMLNIAEVQSTDKEPHEEAPISGLSEDSIAIMQEKVRKGQMTPKELEKILYWRERRLSRQSVRA